VTSIDLAGWLFQLHGSAALVAAEGTIASHDRLVSLGRHCEREETELFGLAG